VTETRQAADTKTTEAMLEETRGVTDAQGRRVFWRYALHAIQGGAFMSQRYQSRQLSTPAFCPRCGKATEHVRGMCRACDPCTAALLASVTVPHEHADEDGRQPYVITAASMLRPAGEVESAS
jgi:hypothetical protein